MTESFAIALNQKHSSISKMQFSLKLALKETTATPYSLARWIKLCLSYVEFVSPSEGTREPARLMKVLAEHSNGLKREELLAHFYEGYEDSSLNRQRSLRICLEKVIQRARAIFFKYDLTIYYCQQTKKYYSLPVFILEGYSRQR